MLFSTFVLDFVQSKLGEHNPVFAYKQAISNTNHKDLFMKLPSKYYVFSPAYYANFFHVSS
jgi:hypothetical protein